MGQFLVEMDGVEGLDGVLILAATNRPDRLTPPCSVLAASICIL